MSDDNDDGEEQSSTPAGRGPLSKAPVPPPYDRGFPIPLTTIPTTKIVSVPKTIVMKL